MLECWFYSCRKNISYTICYYPTCRLASNWTKCKPHLLLLTQLLWISNWTQNLFLMMYQYFFKKKYLKVCIWSLKSGVWLIAIHSRIRPQPITNHVHNANELGTDHLDSIQPLVPDYIPFSSKIILSKNDSSIWFFHRLTYWTGTACCPHQTSSLINTTVFAIQSTERPCHSKSAAIWCY